MCDEYDDKGRRDGGHEDSDEDYEVGYRKPPKHTRFKPGQSGNPGGAPKKKAPSSFGSVLEAALTEKLELPEGDRITVTTRKQLMVRNVVDKAAQGDKRAVMRLFKLRDMAEEKKVTETMVHVALTEELAAVTGRTIKTIKRPVWANDADADTDPDAPEEVVSKADLDHRRAVLNGNAAKKKKGVASTIALLIEQELERKVDVTVRGKRQRMTKREVIATKLANAAATGDVGAIDLLVKLNDRRSSEPWRNRIMIVPNDWKG